MRDNLLNRERIDLAWPDIIGSSVCDESRVVLDYFKEKLEKKEKGFAIDIGAADGICHNNVFQLFNSPYSWDGISVEANPRFDKQRKTLFEGTGVGVYCGAISDKDGIVNMNIIGGKTCGHSSLTNKEGVKVESLTIGTLLERYKAPEHIDYISLDIEGAEKYVVKNWDFDRYIVEMWCIERPHEDNLKEFLIEKGYHCLNPNGKDFNGYKVCHGNTFFVRKGV